MYVLNTGDWHSGHKLGLCNPETEFWSVDENGNREVEYPVLTHTQEYMWKIFPEHVAEVRSVTGDKPVILFIGGDSTHGNKFPEQLTRWRPADQIAIAVANVGAMISELNIVKIRLIGGTGVHSLGDNSADISMETQLRDKYPQIDTQLVMHGLAEVNDVTFDIAHQGPPPGSRTWLKGNVARLYLVSLMLDELADGREPPDVVVRYHYHEYIEVTHTINRVVGERLVPCTSRLFIVPSYCGLNEYGRKVGRSPHKLMNGMLLHDVPEEGLYGLIHKPLISVKDLRAKEKLW